MTSAGSEQWEILATPHFLVAGGFTGREIEGIISKRGRLFGYKKWSVSAGSFFKARRKRISPGLKSSKTATRIISFKSGR
jgi:hypothetical protein